MSNNHHTPVIGTDLVDADNTNAPYSELDTVITEMLTGLEAFAYLQLGESPTVTETYDSANVDADVALRGIAYAGGSANTGAQTGNDVFIGDSGGVEYRAAQGFRVSGAGYLSQFTFTLRASSGAPTGVLSWEIRDNNAGVPTGSVLASGTIANGSVVASGINTVNIAAGLQPLVATGTTYWLVLYAGAQSTGVKWNWESKAVGTYADGQRAFSSNGGSSWSTDGYDCSCTITVSPLLTNDKLEQGFQVEENCAVNTVQLRLKKTGTPTGNLTLEIQTDTAGDPSGAVVTNGTSAIIAASTVTGSYTWITFTYTTPPELSEATQYHLVLKTTDSQSNSNYVEWGADSSTPGYANGVMKSEQSAAWVAESKDAAFILSGTQLANGACLIEMHSTTQGVLPPRMTTAQRDLIATPSNGMLIYNTTTDLINVYADSWAALDATADNNALVEITPQTTFAGQASVSIAIPAGYKDILLRVSMVGDSGVENVRLRLNNDSGANYRYTLGYYLAAATPATAQTSVSLDMYSDTGDDSMYHYEIWLYDYLTTTNHRMGLVEAQYSSADAALAVGVNNWMGVFFWQNVAAAISSLQLARTALITGSYALYGLL